MVTPADLLTYAQQARQTADQNDVVRRFRGWIRQRLANPPAPP
jgi:hypothetical protein